jgi:hypothetical protein
MNLDHLEKIQTLTKQYAAYSRTAIGLGYLVAVLLLPILFFAARALPITVVGAILGGLLSFIGIGLWLWLRQQVSSRLYQGFGVALAPKPTFDLSFVLGVVAGAFLATGLLWFLRSSGFFNFPNTYIFAVPALVIGAVAGWRDAKQSGDMLGFVTFGVGGIVGGGINANADNIAELQRTMQLVLLVGLPLMLGFFGLREHSNYKKLEQEFKSLSGGTP